MERALRIAAAAALGLSAAWLAPTGTASAQDGVTVGGWIEVIAGTSDHDDGVDGISRGTFSRISVSYDTVLDNGLAVAGRAAYQLNQRGTGTVINPTGGRATTGTRMDAGNNFAPDVLFISVGGGFGTVSIGAHAGASCSTMPRPIAFLEGVDQGFFGLFSGVTFTNGTFSESSYCTTAESVSYATPNIGGFTARLTYAPDNASDQSTTLRNAQSPDAQGPGNIEDRVDMAASWSGAMGGANASIGVGYQSGANDRLDSFTVAGTVGFGGFSFGASWFDNDNGPRTFSATEINAASLLSAANNARLSSNPPVAFAFDGDTNAEIDGEQGVWDEFNHDAVRWQNEQDGWTVAGKYEIGALLLGVTYSKAERDRSALAGDVAAAGFSTTVQGLDPAAGATRAAPTATANKVTQSWTSLADDVDESALVLGVRYAIGGGLTAWAEYMDIEQEYTNTKRERVITTNDAGGNDDGTVDPGEVSATEIADITDSGRRTNDDSLFMVGLTLGF